MRGQPRITRRAALTLMRRLAEPAPYSVCDATSSHHVGVAHNMMGQGRSPARCVPTLRMSRISAHFTYGAICPCRMSPTGHAPIETHRICYVGPVSTPAIAEGGSSSNAQSGNAGTAKATDAVLRLPFATLAHEQWRLDRPLCVSFHAADVFRTRRRSGTGNRSNSCLPVASHPGRVFNRGRGLDTPFSSSYVLAGYQVPRSAP